MADKSEAEAKAPSVTRSKRSLRQDRKTGSEDKSEAEAKAPSVTKSKRSLRQDRKTGTEDDSDGTESISISSTLTRKRAQAESARVELEFTKKEAQIMKEKVAKEAEFNKEKAKQEAELTILENLKKVAMVEAEVMVLENSSDAEGSQHLSLSIPPLLAPVEDPVRRTENYVFSHARSQGSQQIAQGSLRENLQQQERHNGDSVLVDNVHSVPKHNLFSPQCEQETSSASEFTRFLLRKDLLLSRLTNFNDRPENYSLWKTCFRSVVDELQVTPNDELDLLIKWLGNESRKQAMSIRAANWQDPSKGLQCVWQRLDDRYGSPEMVESAIKLKLERFPKLTFKDNKQLYDLSDLVCEIEAMMQNPSYRNLLAYYDSSSGVSPIVGKLPYGAQEKWVAHAFNYKERNGVPYPPFSVFAAFIRDLSRLKNDPSFHFESGFPSSHLSKPRGNNYVANQVHFRTAVHAKRTDVSSANSYKTDSSSSNISDNKVCPLHQTNHTLNECKGFQMKPYDERMIFLRSKGICYRCCSTNEHLAKNCNERPQCTKCQSPRHPTALHVHVADRQHTPRTGYGGEPRKEYASNQADTTKENKVSHHDQVSTKCTEVCGNSFGGRSCAKTLLVLVYPKGHKEKAIRTYASVDDQSNASLCSTSFADHFNIEGEAVPYTISSCGSLTETSGRKASGFIIESFDGQVNFELPTLLECDRIPDNTDEIPTPEVALHHPHLKDMAHFLPSLDPQASVQLLIGRDIPDIHHVLCQVTGPPKSPYAQKLPLGWVIIGDVCLGISHPPTTVNVNKLFMLPNGRPSLCHPCPNNLRVKKTVLDDPKQNTLEENDAIFRVTANDDRPGLSVEDRDFIQLMEKEMQRNPSGKWEAPLPFKKSRSRLRNNRQQAVKRTRSLLYSLQKNEKKMKDFIEFMQRIFDNHHAEVAPPMERDDECWYLPIFGVYHPRKPTQIRVVFDSSAQYDGVSLNSVLMQGPDLTNDLLGILLRFRRELVAVTADVQQMFHCFEVSESHRNFLRFIWFRDNDPKKELIDYRMRVHIFGNSPSPAVATFGLRSAAQEGANEFGQDTKDFVTQEFYVDDAVTSFPTSEQAVDLLKRTQASLVKNGNIRLHKIVSNSVDVMKAFPAEDLAKGLTEIDVSADQIPLQRSLGMLWDIQSDMFKFSISSEDKPYTKRGILSTVNSVFDPMGFAAPVVVEGKLILRDVISAKVEWDENLSPEHYERWRQWKLSLRFLENLKISRTYVPFSFQGSHSKQVHVYSDASEKVISAAAYLKVMDEENHMIWGFIMGKAKVAPTNGHTIPRLELCAAVLAVDISLLVSKHLDIPLEDITYHTDSKIVLGYVSNNTRRFSVFVSNRVGHIRKHSIPSQWKYVHTSCNPADQATRPKSAEYMENNPWLVGPVKDRMDHEECVHELEGTLSDPESEPEGVTLITHSTKPVTTLGSHRFQRFSDWTRLVKAVSSLITLVKSLHRQSSDLTDISDYNQKDVHFLTSAEMFIIKVVQAEVYAQEISCLKSKKLLSKDSPVVSLNPFIDHDGILRVGGRLVNSQLSANEKNPAIIPGKHHIALLLVRHSHVQAQHQGRHFTEGVVRASGLWIVGAKRLVSSVIHKCVKCRKLRGRQQTQKMADLPGDRLTPAPPFSFVGVDMFGPWEVVCRKTRGGVAHSKRWALLFVCMVTRGIHIEIVEEMSSSSFINALRRFISLRGNVQYFRSDRGTNFVGATDLLKMDTVNVEDETVRNFLDNKRTKWIFNPPHASHMGGAWERLIGVVRRILDSMMRDVSPKKFTHEVLTTLMAEICAIVNARPITAVSSDPEQPFLLTPSTLLTHKTDNTSTPLQDCSGDLKDLYRKQWKQVQALADTFWNRFKSEYLQTLQSRSKWTLDQRNLRCDDLVLLREKTLNRNDWPIGIVVNAIPSEDGKVRKAVIKVIRDGKPVYYTRPITELVVLLESQN